MKKIKGFKFIKPKDWSSLPLTPGVYVFRGKKEIFYIGKSANIQKRVKSHFQHPTFRDNLYINLIKSIGYLETNSEIEALILEARFIRNLQPRFNVIWRDNKNYFFVGATQEKFPRIFITHQIGAKETENVKGKNYLKKTISSKLSKKTNPKTLLAGPFVDGKPLKQTLRILRKIFPYRTCRVLPKKACFWYQIGQCLAPCQAKTKKEKEKARKMNQKNVSSIMKILKGQKTTVLKDLEKEMEKSSLAEKFEKAAKLRDQIAVLKRVLSNAKIFQNITPRQLQNWTVVQNKLQKILKTREKIQRIEGYDISNIQGFQSTGSMVVFVNGKPQRADYRKFKIKYLPRVFASSHALSKKSSFLNKPNDTAMIKEIISRRLRHFEWPFPQLILIDGGKAQLHAALSEIEKASHLKSTKRTGLYPKVTALAKRRNELFIEGKRNSILLASLPPEISNLFLYIRDESHRFAITYHRQLRRKAFFQ